VNRGGPYTGPIGIDSLERIPAFRPFFFDQTGFPNNTLAELGSSEFESGGLYLNSSFEITNEFDVYAFGGISNKIGRINGIYRLPLSPNQLSVWYPLGFSPEINPEIEDQSLVIGAKGNSNGWFLDTSYGYGRNIFDMKVNNSNNASIGPTTPFSAFAGGYRYGHDIISFDASKMFSFTDSHIDVSFGGEFRVEQYELISGEESSYINGGDTTEFGTPMEPGIQGYRGIREEDALEEIRTNGSAYLELDYSWKKWLISGAIRQEEYSDFGARTNYKIATRLKIINQLILRASFSTGFKAPSLPQIHYQRISSFLNDDGFSSVGVVNTQTPLIGNVLANTDRLNPETSRSLNVGLTSAINRFASFSVDAYATEISDRIGLTGRFPTEANDTIATLLSGTDLEFIQSFGNLIDTRTYGIDAVFATQFSAGLVLFKMDTRFSYLQNEITSFVEIEELDNNNVEVLDRSEQSRIETYVPATKWRNSITATFNKFIIAVSHTRYGETTFLHPDDDNPNNWVLNQSNGVVESRDQVFTPKNTINTNIKYQVLPKIILTLGGINITNQYPDKLTHSDNIVFGVNEYSQNVRPFDLRGAYFYARLNIGL
jgi:iron complex outermembrane receptor protein